MNIFEWYEKLRKPSWTPPDYLFGTFWFSIYCFIALSYCYVFYQFSLGQISSTVLIPFILNLFVHVVFVLALFTLRNNIFTLINISLVLITLIWAIFAIYPIYKWVALINTPYLIWVIIATTLQLTITYLNR